MNPSEKLQKARNLIAHAGSEYSYDGEIVRMCGLAVAYFRIRDGSWVDSGSIGLCDIRPGIGSMSLHKVIEQLERITWECDE